MAVRVPSSRPLIPCFCSSAANTASSSCSASSETIPSSAPPPPLLVDGPETTDEAAAILPSSVAAALAARSRLDVGVGNPPPVPLPLPRPRLIPRLLLPLPLLPPALRLVLLDRSSSWPILDSMKPLMISSSATRVLRWASSSESVDRPETFLVWLTEGRAAARWTKPRFGDAPANADGEGCC